MTARSRLASLMIRNGKPDEASAVARGRAGENPSDADALVMRAADRDRRRRCPRLRSLTCAPRCATSRIQSAADRAARTGLHPSGDVALAEQTLRARLVQANPRDVQTRLALAQFLVNEGQADEARPVLDQLVTDEPNNLEALEGYARLLLMLNDPAGALQAATTLQTLQPKSATGFQLAGVGAQAASAQTRRVSRSRPRLRPIRRRSSR